MPPEKINPDGLSGKGYEFAVLYNALMDAGFGSTFASQIAAKIYSGETQIECECKK